MEFPALFLYLFDKEESSVKSARSEQAAVLWAVQMGIEIRLFTHINLMSCHM